MAGVEYDEDRQRCCCCWCCGCCGLDDDECGSCLLDERRVERGARGVDALRPLLVGERGLDELVLGERGRCEPA